ncbi:hypothetical protein LguiA_011550 [Lonicera macranthoides]
MPFPMRIQPIDFNTPEGSNSSCYEPVKPVVKSRFKRLIERQLPSVLRLSATDKGGAGIEDQHCNKDGTDEFEPSSICLAKMVQNFIEESNDKQSAVKCGRSRCRCFNRNCNDSSEEELESFNCFGDSSHSSAGDACEILKSLVPCASFGERNLLAEISKIVDKKQTCKLKDDCIREILTDNLLALGYNASICKSRWEKSPLYPAGEYDYVDVIVEGDRLIVDIDFRSEFEIARSTKTYKAILQTLPHIFVGKADRLERIIHIVSDAAKQSLKKKGMPFPPWRKAEYVKAKWLSSNYTRITASTQLSSPQKDTSLGENIAPVIGNGEEGSGDPIMFSMSESFDEMEKNLVVVKPWEPPEIKTKNSQIGVKIITGLASIIEDEP